MQEIVTEKTFLTALTAVTVLLLLVGIALVVVARRGGKQALRTAGIATAISAPALWLLWFVYNGVVKQFGLDSVKGLGVNVAVFVFIGAVLGALVGLLQRRSRT